MTVSYRQAFRYYIGVKDTPNDHEQYLFTRAKKYARILSYIPGVEMIAVVNSLAMYATHKDSDIDFFFVTRPGTIWFVRFSAIIILWIHGVWRHGQDIAGNICLSFFITTDAMDLESIAIPDDLYLAFWIESVYPLYDSGGIHEAFVQKNYWIKAYTGKGEGGKEGKEKIQHIDGSPFLGGKRNSKYSGNIFSAIKIFLDFLIMKSTFLINSLLRTFLLPRALKTYEEKGYPSGVIILDSMLKFHDQDRRQEIRDEIMKKYFDK